MDEDVTLLPVLFDAFGDNESLKFHALRFCVLQRLDGTGDALFNIEHEQVELEPRQLEEVDSSSAHVANRPTPLTPRPFGRPSVYGSTTSTLPIHAVK